MDERQELLRKRLESLCQQVRIDTVTAKLKELQALTYSDEFWTDHDNSREVSQEITRLQKDLDDLDMLQLLLEASELDEMETLLRDYEIRLFLSEEFDTKDALLSIHAGQGGTEAMDWTAMLYRMYSRYCERKKLDVEILDMVNGEEAGIKSVVMKIKAPFA